MSEVSSDASRPETGARESDLGNLRDIGGFQVADGRFIRSNLFLRSPGPERLTVSARHHLEHLRPAVIIDFRGRDEAAANPDLIGGGYEGRRIGLHIEPQVAAAMRALPADDVDGMRSVMTARYRSYIADHGPLFEQFLQVAASHAAPLVFHCTAGKDRTGTAAALLLAVLGVSRDAIRADYLDSNRRLASHIPAPGVPPTMAQVLLEVRADYLEAVWEALELRYGSIEGFARSSLGSVAATDTFRNWACS